MVMVDDASRRMLIDLPKINEHIISKGATVPNYLLSQPTCAPSRATILRGQYSHNTGIKANNFDGHEALWHFQKNGCEASNLATWLHDAGYRTGLVGKYMNGYGEETYEPGPVWYKPDGWDYFWAVGGDAGEGYDYWAYDNGIVKYYPGTDRANYLTTVIRSEAEEFLDDALPREESFFLVVTPKAPHHPAVPQDEYSNAYPGYTYPKGTQNPAFNEALISDKPRWVKINPLLSTVETTQIDIYYRRKLQCLKSVDDLVDALVDKIGQKMNNTYFIFCSDNGFHHGEHRLGWAPDFGGKNSVYEEDIRVPLYIRGPGIPEASTVDQLIGNVDLAPTFCEMAGVTPGIAVDGRSFLPLVKGTPVPWRNYYLLSRGKGEPFAGFRAADFVFNEFTEDQGAGNVRGEHYNLDVISGDLPELTNTYNNLTQTDLATYQERVEDLLACEGATCRTADV